MKTNKDRSYLLFLLTWLLFLAGCGGGTTGTGNPGGNITRSISGGVSDLAGQPVAGVEITVLSSGVSTSSAADGSFELVGVESSDSIALLIEKEDLQSELRIEAVPDESSEIEIAIQVDVAAARVELLSVEFREPTPQPTPQSPDDEEEGGPDTNPGDSDNDFYTLLTGRVVFADGRPAEDVSIELVNVSERVVTNSRGGFRFRRLRPQPRELAIELSLGRIKGAVLLDRLPTGRNIEVIVEIKIDATKGTIGNGPSADAVMIVLTRTRIASL